MDTEPGEGWADAVSKILRMGTNNPESNRILSKAKTDDHVSIQPADSDESDAEEDAVEEKKLKTKAICGTIRLKPIPQSDALLENELKNDATRGVVHLFNAVKTVNPKSDKKRKKKKKKKLKKGRKRKH